MDGFFSGSLFFSFPAYRSSPNKEKRFLFGSLRNQAQQRPSLQKKPRAILSANIAICPGPQAILQAKLKPTRSVGTSSKLTKKATGARPSNPHNPPPHNPPRPPRANPPARPLGRSSWHPPPPQLGFWERLLDFRSRSPATFWGRGDAFWGQGKFCLRRPLLGRDFKLLVDFKLLDF